MIMERISGPSLDKWIAQQPEGVLRTAAASRLFTQLLAALQHAHRAGFVHCDVKPENVRLHEDVTAGSEHAVLLDWGYARRIGLQSGVAGGRLGRPLASGTKNDGALQRGGRHAQRAQLLALLASLRPQQDGLDD